MLTFAGVESDSRCPTDVRCIRAGEAKIRLRSVKAGVSREDIILVLGGDTGETVVRDGLASIVMDLRPAAVATKPIAPGDYIVKLVVSRE